MLSSIMCDAAIARLVEVVNEAGWDAHDPAEPMALI